MVQVIQEVENFVKPRQQGNKKAQLKGRGQWVGWVEANVLRLQTTRFCNPRRYIIGLRSCNLLHNSRIQNPFCAHIMHKALRYTEAMPGQCGTIVALQAIDFDAFQR